MNEVKNARKVLTLVILLSIVSLVLSIGWATTILYYNGLINSLKTTGPSIIDQDLTLGDQGIYLLNASEVQNSEVILYRANVNFYNQSGILKINIEIGNCGALETKWTELYIGTSPTNLEDQKITPVTIASAGIQGVTVEYNWTSGASYYFRVASSSGQALNWTQQTPMSQQAAVPFRISPEIMTVRAGETFSVEIVFEDMPTDLGALGFEFNITWDSSVIKAVSMKDILWHSVTPESEWDNIWVIRNTVSQGSVLYAQQWLSFQRARENGYFAPVSGNGTVARITFQSLASGETKLHFETAKCAGQDSLGSVVPIMLRPFDATVTVE